MTPPREPDSNLLVRCAQRQTDPAEFYAPVRPRTRVTLTSLTGTFDEASIVAVDWIDENASKIGCGKSGELSCRVELSDRARNGLLVMVFLSFLCAALAELSPTANNFRLI